MKFGIIGAGATGLAAAGSGALGSFFVLSSVESGVDETTAAIFLVFGSVVGILARVVLGARADRGNENPWRTLSVMFVVAAISFAALATGSIVALVIAMPFAFATAFAWPGLCHYAIMRSNPSAPSVATGITMTGSFTGAVVGPLMFGILADHVTYGWAWVFTVISMTAAAVVMGQTGRRIPMGPNVMKPRTA